MIIEFHYSKPGRINIFISWVRYSYFSVSVPQFTPLLDLFALGCGCVEKADWVRYKEYRFADYEQAAHFMFLATAYHQGVEKVIDEIPF